MSYTQMSDDFYGDAMPRDDSYHPVLDPKFNPKSEEQVWYLSHPLAPDDRFTFQENMDDVVKLVRICFDAGLRVIAPYHTQCLALDDTNPEYRRMGLECDCFVARSLGHIIMSGHKLSSGMEHELKAAMRNPKGAMIDLIGYSHEEAAERLMEWQKLR